MLNRLEDAPKDETLATGVAYYWSPTAAPIGIADTTASLTLKAQEHHEQRKRQFGGQEQACLRMILNTASRSHWR